MYENTTSIPYNASSWIPFYSRTYHAIVPFNISLAVFIIVQNSIIIADYYKDRRRIIAIMFMSIAAADMVSAVGELVRAAVGLSCTDNHDFFIPTWVVQCYISVAMCGYACSIFYNIVLVITKTINMVSPFNRLNTAAIKISLVLGSLFWLAVALAGNVLDYMSKRGHHTHSCYEQWVFLEGYWYLGVIVVEIFLLNVLHLEADGETFTFWYTFIGNVEVVLPCLLVLVCMVIQIVFIWKHLSSNTAHHVNITVFMVSVLYFVCNGSYGIYYFLSKNITNTPEIIMHYTLPLLNAAIFPIIIMVRKPDLRQKYKRFLVGLFCFPLRICRSLRGAGTGEDGLETLAREDGVKTPAREDGVETLAGPGEDRMETPAREDGVETPAWEDEMETPAGEDGVDTSAREDGMETSAREDGSEDIGRGGWSGETGRGGWNGDTGMGGWSGDIGSGGQR